MGSGSVSDLGPQLFPDREDSTNVGPDVPMSVALGEPTTTIHQNLKMVGNVGFEPHLVVPNHACYR